MPEPLLYVDLPASRRIHILIAPPAPNGQTYSWCGTWAIGADAVDAPDADRVCKRCIGALDRDQVIGRRNWW